MHGISQARTLEQVAVSFPGDLPDPGIEPVSPAISEAQSLPAPGLNQCLLLLLSRFSRVRLCVTP